MTRLIAALFLTLSLASCARSPALTDNRTQEEKDRDSCVALGLAPDSESVARCAAARGRSRQVESSLPPGCAVRHIGLNTRVTC